MNRLPSILCSLVLLTIARSASSQSAAAPPTRATAPVTTGVSVGGFLDVGGLTLLAGDSAKAVLGRSTIPIVGVGGRFVWREHLFAEARVGRMRQTGQRIYQIDGERFPLGIPLTVRLVPVEVTAGYRFSARRHIRPFVGVGGGVVWYDEDSRFAEGDENARMAFGEYHVVGGGEIRVWKWISASGSVVFSSVPHAIGGGGISSDLGQTNLGGTSVRARVVIGR